MTERSTPYGGAARVGIIALASAGWGDIRGSFARLWPVWLGWAVASGAAQYAGHQLIKPGGSGLALTPELFAYEAASSVGMAVFAGLTLRGFLAPETPVWRLDRGFFAYVGLVSLVSTYAVGRAMQLHTLASKTIDHIVLTPRERECLQWAAVGKSEWEISQILGISEHVSEKHLLNAKSKLGAVNRVQAVAEAIRRGYIS